MSDDFQQKHGKRAAEIAQAMLQRGIELVDAEPLDEPEKGRLLARIVANLPSFFKYIIALPDEEEK